MKKKLITQSDNLIVQGVAKKLIRHGDDGMRIEYLRHGISRDWTMLDGRLNLRNRLEFTHFLSAKMYFTPINKGRSVF
jgi:hypothetical protein